MAKEINRVFLVPDDIEKEINLLHLKHPRTNSSTLCALDSSSCLFEIVHFSEELSSWFVDESVIADGNLFILTIADPLYFILPYVSQTTKYCRLEDLLMDEKFPDIHHLLDCTSPRQLQNIFDFKESAGFKVFCFNKAKTLRWLEHKVRNTAASLKSKDINISDGSKAALLQSSYEENNEEKYLEYSCQLISEYISDELSNELFTALKIEQKGENVRLKVEDSMEKTKKKNTEPVNPIDDYSKNYSLNSLQDKQKAKLSATQKKLMKVDKTGMKSISSFFQKKS